MINANLDTCYYVHRAQYMCCMVVSITGPTYITHFKSRIILSLLRKSNVSVNGQKHFRDRNCIVQTASIHAVGRCTGIIVQTDYNSSRTGDVAFYANNNTAL